MIHVAFSAGNQGVMLTDAQYEAGMAVARRPEATHFQIWEALKGAGVPVRNGSATPASTAATALREHWIRSQSKDCAHG